MRTKAYSYLRISTPAQEMGDGVRRQIEGSRRYAVENGYELIETFSDIGVSGYKGQNSRDGQLGIFLEAIDNGKIVPRSLLIVESLDRLSRENVFDAFTLFTNILNKDITIVTLMDGQTYNKDSLTSNPSLLFASIATMLRANEESETKSRRLKAVWDRKRKEIGKSILTSKAPAWLIEKKDRTGFEVDEAKALTVRKIFSMCIDGVGIYKITHFLNKNEMYPPIATANHWSNSYVSKILHNRSVIGEFRPGLVLNGRRVEGEEVIKNYYPSIIDEETFLLAQSSLRSRRQPSGGRKGKQNSNLFTGIVKCKKCGGNLIIHNKGRGLKGGVYLKCRNSILKNGCNRPAWKYLDFERSFFKFIKELDFGELVGGSDDSKLLELDKSICVDQETIERNRKKIFNATELLLEQDNIHNDYAVTLNSHIEKLSLQNQDLEGQIKEKMAARYELIGADLSVAGDDLLGFYNSVTADLPDEEIFVLRSRIQINISRIIKRIEVTNGFDLLPWEISVEKPDTQLSQRYIEHLKGKGIVDDEGLLAYIQSVAGQRDFDKFERHYTIIFKSGDVRIVWPFSDNSIFFDRQPLLRFVGKSK